MVKLKINNIEYEVADGLTIQTFAKSCGIYIPTLCHKEGLPHFSSCMVCMVRDNRTGNYLPSCSALAQDGMDIDTESEQVVSLRKKAVEMLLSEHRAECEAPCHVVCPAGYDVPLMNRLISTGDFKGAVELSATQTKDAALKCPECAAYCENACRRKKIDLPVSIRNLQIFINHQTDKVIYSSENPVASKKVAKRFTSRTGKLETEELTEWLKECTNGDKRSRETADSASAQIEAGSCMHCDCRAKDGCSLRDIADEFSVKDPRGKIVNSPVVKKINHNTGLIFENAKCIKCGLCVRVCEDSTDEPALCFIHRGFVSIISEPLTASFEDILKTKSKLVVDVCPTGALSLMRYFIALTFFLLYSLISEAQISSDNWPLFRGTADLSGRYDQELPSDPKLLWSVKTGARTKSSPVISDGTIFFGNDIGTLTAVATDGKIKWKYEAGSLIEAAPLVFGNKVIVGLNDGKLVAVDKVTGKLIWTYTTDNQISGSANVWVSGNKAGLVVGSYDYYLHCIDPRTGKEVWKIETDNYVNGTPSIQDGKIVFGGCDGMIRVVDPLTGNQKDTINVGVYIAASPALAGDMAYFGDYDGTVFGLNIKTKKMAWKIYGNEQSGSVLAVPAIRDNFVVIGNEDKNLYCYNGTNGKLIWKYRTNGRIVGSAVIALTKVLFTSMDGTVNILNLSDGKSLWRFNAGSGISSSPAVVKGRFYILSEDGRLMAFGAK